MAGTQQDLHAIESRLFARTQIHWAFADPFETQSKEWAPVPSEPGGFVWMRRREPGSGPEIGQDVLFTGSTRNLRRRLHDFSSGRTASDVTLQRLFEVVIAPALRPEVLQQIVVSRRSLPIARMWVRDHVVFAFASAYQFVPEEIGASLFDPTGSPTDHPVGSTPSLGSVLTGISSGLKERLQPWLNNNPAWTALGDTWHEDHDITLPILPSPPPDMGQH
jgi:hypothetical protein